MKQLAPRNLVEIYSNQQVLQVLQVLSMHGSYFEYSLYLSVKTTLRSFVNPDGLIAGACC